MLAVTVVAQPPAPPPQFTFHPRPRGPIFLDAPTYQVSATDVGTAAMPASCTAYNTAIATGVSTPAGGAHPGACRQTKLTLLIDGVPAKQYIDSLVSPGAALPYVTRYTPGPGFFPTQCATVSHFQLHVSALVQTTALHWQNGRTPASACAVEAGKHDPSALGAQDRKTDANALLSRFAQDLRAQFVTGAPLQTCSILAGSVFGELQLAQQVATELRAIVAAEQVRWSAMLADLEGPAAQQQCAVQCNQCDGSGWAGTIVRTFTLTAAGYSHQQTDTLYVGGTPLVSSPTTTHYPFNWTANGTGSKTSTNEAWIVAAGFTGSCSSGGGCLEVKINPDGTMTFHEIGSQIVVQNSVTIVGSHTQPGATTETQTLGTTSAPLPIPGTLSIVQPPYTPDVNGHQPPDPACYAYATPQPSTCIQTWTWYLTQIR